jgi:hypothetical protein
MKKVMLMLLMAAPFWAFSQEKEKTDKKEGEKKEAVSAQQVAGTNDPKKGGLDLTAAESMFLELIISEGQNGTVIRADIGRESANSTDDKLLQQKMIDLRTLTFNSMPDAMAHLSGMGFKWINSYEVHKGDRVETHLVFERRNSRGKGREEGTPRPVNVGTRPTAVPAPAPAPADSKGTKPAKK